MKKILFFLFFVFSVILPQQKKVFDFDYAQFAYDSTSNYLEVYYSFNQNNLTSSLKDNKQFVEGLLHVTLTDTVSNKILVDREWKINHQAEDSLESTKNLVGVLGFQFPEGYYRMDISGGNKDNSNKDSFTEFLKSVPYYQSNVTLSDIQLATNIIQDSQNKESIFFKNSLEVIPGPTGVFSESLPVTYYYSEIYNLDKVSAGHELKIHHIVYNSKKQVIFKKTRNIGPGLKSKVEVGSVVINKYPTDTYTILLSVVDSAANFAINSSKKFYVFNPGVKVTDTVVDLPSFSSEFGSMSEEELDDLYSKSKYIASITEAKRFATAKGVEGKRDFLFQFWKARDNDPSTPQNEAFHQYLGRIESANVKFGTPTKIGWKTDRGRVYILNGEPSEIERFPNQMDSKPYEVWHYNDIEGGVVFVFADLTGFSDYMLVHSSKRGELRDDNWSRRVFSN